MEDEDIITRQISAISRQLDVMTDRIERIERQSLPFWSHTLWYWPGDPPGEPDATTLSDMLQYYERSQRRSVSVYYLLFAALYLRNGLAILLQVSTITALGIFPLRLAVAFFYLVVGLANVSCIFIPLERNQQRVVIPSALAAALMFTLSLITNISVSQFILAVLSASFWSAMIVIHLTFGAAIKGRVGLRDFVLRLAMKSREQHRDEEKRETT